MSEKKGRFEREAEEYLDKQNIGELRAYGRRMGVEKPTELKKQALIAAIIDVFLGRVSPVPRSKRGAPIRADYFNPKIAEKMDDLFNSYGRKYDPTKMFAEVLENVGQNKLVVCEPLEESDIYAHVEKSMDADRYRLIPFSTQYVDAALYIDLELVEEYEIREGDTLVCRVRNEADGSGYFVTRVISINGEDPHKIKRFSFDEAEVYLPEKQIVLDGNSLVEKFVDYFAPLGFGQRYAIVAPPKTGKTSALLALAKTLSEREDLELLVLLVEQAPETIAQFKRVLGSEQLVATGYGDDPEDVMGRASTALRRVKRYAEMGKDTVLLVDGLVELALAYNSVVPAVNKKRPIDGLESDTIRYIKKFFATARNFFNDGSLTMVASIKTESGNPVSDFLASELADMANGRLVLSGTLAQKHIFPAVDCINSFSDRSDELLSREGGKIERIVRRKIFPVLPGEQVIDLLGESYGVEDFYEKAIDNIK